MSFSKAKAQRIHAKRRLRERYGASVNRDDMRRMVSDIQSQKGEYLGRQSNRLTVWRVALGESTATVIYDAARKTIVTALPPEAVVDVLAPGGVPTTVVA